MKMRMIRISVSTDEADLDDFHRHLADQEDEVQ